MKNTYLNLSTKIEKEILNILEELSTTARNLGLNFFIVGATARDIIFNYGYDIHTGRATHDIDLGINLRTWDQYDQFCTVLCEGTKFKSTKTIHKFEYDNYKVDIIPFGGISDKGKNILWPPDQKTKMNLMGFEEAYNNSIIVKVRENPHLEIPIISPTGFALLKLLSWAEKEDRKYKDAYDLNLVLRYYDNLGNADRIYEFDEIIKQDEFEYESAFTMLLGYDIASIAYEDTIKEVLKILINETKNTNQNKLVEQLMQLYPNGNFEDTIKLLKAMINGILLKSDT